MSETGNSAQAQEAVEAVETVVVGKKSKKGGSGNLIMDIAAEVENLTKGKALTMADNLAETIESDYFKLGGVLKLINDNSWFEGYESFDLFVYEKYGFQGRKARYLINIYTELVTKQIPWEKVAGLGWTKLKELAPILTLDNVDEWVNKASAVTVLELIAMLKAKLNSSGKESSEKTTDDVVVLKFKMNFEQAETVKAALAKAKGELGTDVDTVALENIAAGYVGGTVTAVQTDLGSVMKAAGWEAVLGLFDSLFPNIDLTVTEKE